MFKRKKRQKAREISSMAELEELAEDGRPILIDFFQFGCSPCQVMDGIVNELANEFGESAEVVKVNVANAPDMIRPFKVQSTPTFVVVSPMEKAKATRLHQRWRASGLVKKDALTKVLTDAGAVLAAE
ncbi:MAG: thioredoxin family protein [Acidimicrobiia bacterium]|nr:thioredoxin family protein [Acidimicrobiia bacterium]